MKNIRRTFSLLGATASMLIILGTLAMPASAFSGRYNGASLQGYYYYDWTYSYAEGSAPSGRVLVWAKQDGGTNTATAGLIGQFKKISNYGYEWNVDDGAGAYVS